MPDLESVNSYSKEVSMEEQVSVLKKIKQKPEWVEPKMKFRFRVQFTGLDIPDYLFRKYKLYNEADKLIFETCLYETVDVTLNPLDFFDVREIKVDFVDPIGETISSWVFNVEGIAFENVGNYGISDLLTHEFKFEVDKKTFKITKK